ncbi:MAG: hypothetical protein R6U96_05345 [Promethearchaeia archaeon]
MRRRAEGRVRFYGVAHRESAVRASRAVDADLCAAHLAAGGLDLLCVRQRESAAGERLRGADQDLEVGDLGGAHREFGAYRGVYRADGHAAVL